MDNIDDTCDMGDMDDFGDMGDTDDMGDLDDMSPPKSLWAMRATDGGSENSQHAENISVTMSGTTGGDRQRFGSALLQRGERWHSAADLRRMAARGGSGAVGGGGTL